MFPGLLLAYLAASLIDEAITVSFLRLLKMSTGRALGRVLVIVPELFEQFWRQTFFHQRYQVRVGYYRSCRKQLIHYVVYICAELRFNIR